MCLKGHLLFPKQRSLICYQKVIYFVKNVVCLTWDKASIIIKLPIQVFHLCTYHNFATPMDSLIRAPLTD